jgi:hypothetical protein
MGPHKSVAVQENDIPVTIQPSLLKDVLHGFASNAKMGPFTATSGVNLPCNRVLLSFLCVKIF